MSLADMISLLRRRKARPAPLDEIRVDRIRTSEVYRCWQIDDEAFTDAWPIEAMYDLISQQRSDMMVARSGNLPIGYLAYTFQPIPTCRSSVPVILRLAVDPHYHRRGVASQLIGHYLHWLRGFHQPPVMALAPVRETNLPGQLLMRHCGFRCTRILPGFFSNDQAAYMFHRSIARPTNGTP